MQNNILHDDRGVAVILEVLLVAVVLTLAGLALYQADHRPKGTPVSAAQSTPSTAQGLAASAAAVSVQASASDAALSAAADNSTSVLSQTDTDIDNLGNSSNASY
jgi:hypothetical protein